MARKQWDNDKRKKQRFMIRQTQEQKQGGERKSTRNSGEERGQDEEGRKTATQLRKRNAARRTGKCADLAQRNR